jgi:hypothetical protein
MLKCECGCKCKESGLALSFETILHLSHTVTKTLRHKIDPYMSIFYESLMPCSIEHQITSLLSIPLPSKYMRNGVKVNVPHLLSNLKQQLRYACVIQFVVNILQFLPIRFTQQNFATLANQL